MSVTQADELCPPRGSAVGHEPQLSDIAASEVVGAMVDGVLVVDSFGRVASANRAAGELLGYSEAELRGMPGDRVLTENGSPLLFSDEQLDRLMRGEPLVGMALELVPSNGTAIPVHVNCSALRRDEGELSGLVLVARDMRDMLRLMASEAAERELRRHSALLSDMVRQRTEELERSNQQLASNLRALARTQEQLVVSERLAALGALSASIAHEINNPLSYVCGNLEFTSDELARLMAVQPMPQLDELRAALDEARHGADRVQSIVRGLKAFSRADQDSSELLDVRTVVSLSIKMAVNQIKLRAQLVQDLAPVPLVQASSARLGQVFINLLVNAVQAIPEGHPDLNRIVVSTRTDARGWAVVEFADSGCGIAPEIRRRLFEPFFTTKPIGEGTGLGLSICHGIVSAIGGEIEVDSEVGCGSRFRVLLPAAGPPPARTSQQERS
jgi:two-component system, NtrC family, sensor kinase